MPKREQSGDDAALNRDVAKVPVLELLPTLLPHPPLHGSDNGDGKRNDDYAWRSDVDYRAEPHRYRVGRGEQGVLTCEPYKSEILPHWRFRTTEIAAAGSRKIFDMFEDYVRQNDFVGADLARKFLQMGFTRARRYANWKGGRKYVVAEAATTAGSSTAHPAKRTSRATTQLGAGSPEKAQAAAIYFAKWKEAEANPTYAALKANWKRRFG